MFVAFSAFCRKEAEVKNHRLAKAKMMMAKQQRERDELDGPKSRITALCSMAFWQHQHQQMGTHLDFSCPIASMHTA